MHGDNGDEGNIFREPAGRPGALEELRTTTTEILGEANCSEFLKLYGLDQAEDLTDEERSWRLHRIPEDARFYLPSAELQRVWPEAAFYHLEAKSPFTTSRYASDSYHTLDLLYVSTNFSACSIEIRPLGTAIQRSVPGGRIAVLELMPY
jgi:hypothetical protein